MNIFKVLTSGDGSMDEPNISAFLGYLLNPNEDHGLKDGLLKLFLKELFATSNEFSETLKKEFSVKSLDDLLLNENVLFELLFEQSFDPDLSDISLFGKSTVPLFKRKQIVDIFLIISYIEEIVFDSNKKSKSARKEKKFSRSKIPKLVVLLENKIKGVPTENQLLLQNIYSHVALSEHPLLKKIKKNIYCLYLTPDNLKFKKEWLKTIQSDHQYSIASISRKQHLKVKGSQIRWTKFRKNEIVSSTIAGILGLDPDGTVKNESLTVSEMLEQLLAKEQQGLIDPWPEYTRHCVKAFYNYIINHFSYTKQPPFSNSTSGKTRIEFYSHLLEMRYRTKEELTSIANVENKLMEIYESENQGYSIGQKPMLTFYPANKDRNYYLRIEIQINQYEIKAFGHEALSIGIPGAQYTVMDDEGRVNGLRYIFKRNLFNQPFLERLAIASKKVHASLFIDDHVQPRKGAKRTRRRR